MKMLILFGFYSKLIEYKLRGLENNILYYTKILYVETSIRMFHYHIWFCVAVG